MNAMKRSALLLLVLAAGGCGYTTASPFPGDVKSVYVEMWTRGRGVYRRDLEMRLTEAVIKRIELDTPYKLVPKSRADTMLSGSLDMVQQRALSFDPDTGRPREMAVTFVVSFTWTDLRGEGKVLVQRSNFRAEAAYVPAEPLDEEFFHGGEDVINRLAKRIVEQLESPW